MQYTGSKKSGFSIVKVAVIVILVAGIGLALKLVISKEDEFAQHEVVIDTDSTANYTEEELSPAPNPIPKKTKNLKPNATAKVKTTKAPNVKAKHSSLKTKPKIDYSVKPPVLSAKQKANKPPVDCPWIKMNDRLSSYLNANKEADVNKDGFLGLFEYWDHEWPYKGKKINEAQRRQTKHKFYKEYLNMAFPEADIDQSGNIDEQELAQIIKKKKLPKHLYH